MEPAACRWGILATGRIARDFATNLRAVPGAEVVAVGSRSPGSAEAFAAEHGSPGCRAHGSYDALVADPDVDVVYVASPHAFHLEHARLALEAGKHVLCEKPLALNVAEAEEMLALARTHDRFLMEAMWMTCHPVIRAVADGVHAGRFGTPRQLHADLGFVVEKPPGDRMLDPALGAGALLDMGVYPLTLADLLLGPATTLAATAVLDDRSVDVDVAVAGRHEGGAVSALTASMTSASSRTATLATDAGRIDLPGGFHHPAYAVWTPRDGEPERIEGLGRVLGTGLGNEAAEVARCLAEGLRESPLVPHDRTLRVLRAMDDVRRQVGVRYAADSPVQGGSTGA
ncbi:Gfo/Idh/MocA family protein [Nocardioides euryhalodurans]|uniref:Gfo/Idh/MocA family oxidoreductase n=1 Tax=Nocardioides euryhalodurans TaxID=2518370 RepID=A0A4P7GMQ8_9ACTN|nr:Gfo/Idh/MocA family oxidoreductase [Nocardioides euryhalodurans]QBR93458.1 Gfo/Idh/MocA family oxidoreductase [Nocardioides euryhalodurans]